MFGKDVRIGLNIIKLELLILAPWGLGWSEAPQSWQRHAQKPWRDGDDGERCLELSPGKNLFATVGQQHTAFCR